ncbi:MAG: RNA polymerase sigma factor [Candidatus Aminicenantes bacterium]
MGQVDFLGNREPHNVLLLIERIKEGDREAFMEITRIYQKKVYLLAYSYLRNNEDALDIVQETFLRLYQKVDMFRADKNFQTWLLQIAKNLCIDYYRKNYSRSRDHQRDTDIEKVNVTDQSEKNAHSYSDLQRVFAGCLERLTDRQRLIFVMKHYNNLEYKEIAQILRISVGTVKSLHFKAVQNLRALMTPYMGEQT